MTGAGCQLPSASVWPGSQTPELATASRSSLPASMHVLLLFFISPGAFVDRESHLGSGEVLLVLELARDSNRREFLFSSWFLVIGDVIPLRFFSLEVLVFHLPLGRSCLINGEGPPSLAAIPSDVSRMLVLPRSGRPGSIRGLLPVMSFYNVTAVWDRSL